jgi:DNA-binding winged helix-turn-helix (wHTH) protein
MAQAVLNQRSESNLESAVLGMSNHKTAGADRFDITPGKLSHFLEGGYSLGASSQRAAADPMLALDRYHIVLIPQDIASGRAVKPFTQKASTDGLMVLTWKELVSRVRMELDDTTPAPKTNPNVVEFGTICVDYEAIEVRRSNRPVRLSAMEFKALKFFLANPNRVISRDELLNEVWGYNNYPCTRTVDNHVLRLRQKLEPDFSNPIYLRTVFGFGYRFTPAGEDLETSRVENPRRS